MHKKPACRAGQRGGNFACDMSALPMPVATTRPVVPRMYRQAAAKGGPSAQLSADTASASMEMVRCAESTKN
ncbi:MAG: hypothetical protein CM15mP89_0670 [Gammaproteobacteria bacterium]|nr:MAG: hypothetical protein CM15mP89_0670 [Gammaproteobacteria bacterium]